MPDYRLTLDQLEGKEWPAPEFKSALTLQCYSLRHKPLVEFTPDELRVMIGQEIGLEYLVPMAIRVLRSTPLIEATYYEGDLLSNVCLAPVAYWESHEKERIEVHHIIDAILEMPAEARDTVKRFREKAA